MITKNIKCYWRKDDGKLDFHEFSANFEDPELIILQAINQVKETLGRDKIIFAIFV